MLKTRVAAIGALLLVSVGHLTGSEPLAARITFEDLASVEGISAPVLSPDGKEFALVERGQIVLMPAEGGWPVSLTTTPGGKAGLSWSPDGRALAFASQGGIWVVSAKGGQPRRLTNTPPGPGDPRSAGDRAPRWSPSGTWILFETGRRGNNDLMVVSEDGTRTNLLTVSDADQSAGAWSPDGRAIAYVDRSLEHFSGALTVVDFDPVIGMPKGNPRALYTSPTDRGGGWQIRGASWAPDGKSLAAVLQDSGWDKVYLIPSAGGPPKPLTTGEGEDQSATFSPDGKLLAIVSNRAQREAWHVWIAPVDGSAPRQLTSLGPGMESNPQWSRDGSQIYFLRNSPAHPENLLVAPVSGRAAPRFLTNTLPHNFAAAGFPMPEVVRYKSKDGLEIAAMLYKPRGFKVGAGHPAILWIHGGPEGQDAFSWDPWAHFLSQEGYVVLEPNYRGSSGYGEKFRNLNVKDSGGGELDDVVAGAQYLVAQGLAESTRIGIGGGSHGGTMVAYAVTKHPDVFKVAVELFGVVDRATFNERTNRNSAIRWMMKMGGTPDESPAVYEKARSLSEVAKIKTPVLVMHGEEDPQVPPYESTQFVEALKKHGKVHVYVTYPREGHGFAERDHRLDAWKKQLAFLNKYLQPPFGQSITSTEGLVIK